MEAHNAAFEVPKEARSPAAPAQAGAGKGRRNAAAAPLNVFRSSAHIYVQVIDDEAGHTIAAASDLEEEVKVRAGEGAAKVARAKATGEVIAERAKAAGYPRIVFDRGGFLYHGRIKAVAEGAREGGLDF